jgi:hypothetical protein
MYNEPTAANIPVKKQVYRSKFNTGNCYVGTEKTGTKHFIQNTFNFVVSFKKGSSIQNHIFTISHCEKLQGCSKPNSIIDLKSKCITTLAVNRRNETSIEQADSIGNSSDSY